MLDFPTSPVEGQTHFDEGQLWTFTDGAWIVGALTSELTEIMDSAHTDNNAGWAVMGTVLIQWGQAVSDAGGSAVVTYPKAFKANTDPSVTLNPFAETDQNVIRRTTVPVFGERSLRFNAYTLQQNGSLIGSAFFNWFAIGEAPDDLQKTEHVLGGNGELAPQVMVEDDAAAGWLVIGDVLYCWGAFSTDGTGTVPVTYPQAFESNPAVSCSGINAVGTSRIFTVTSPTPTGFTGVCQDTAATGSSRSAYWTAFGPAPDALKKPKSLIGGTGQIAVQTVSDGVIASDSGHYVVGDMLIQWGTGTTDGSGAGTIVYSHAYPAGVDPAITCTPRNGAGFTIDVTTPFDHTGFDVRTKLLSSGAGFNTTFYWWSVGEAPDDMKESKDVLGGTVADVARVSEAGSGYQIVGKKLIQWGRADNFSVGGALVSFPKAFKSAPSVTAMVAGVGGTLPATNQYVVMSEAPTATSVTFRQRYQDGTNNVTSDVPVDWIAVGEVPDAEALPEHVVGKGVMEYHDPTGASSWRIIGETLECWGTTSAAATQQVINFPKTFATTPQVSGTVTDTNSSTCNRALADVSSATFNIYSTGGSATSGNVSWHAIGKWDGVS